METVWSVCYTNLMFNAPSLLRIEENKALSAIRLEGSVLDLGGEKDSDYLKLIGGQFNVLTLNNDPAARADINHDLEKELPFEDSSYDNVLLINVIEHIFNFRLLLAEAVRVLKPKGKLIIVVPFLFPIHPSPNDHWRFTSQALEGEVRAVGVRELKITFLGSGVFASCFLFIDRLLPKFLRYLNYKILRHLMVSLDAAWSWLAKLLRKKYSKNDYPLGLVLVCTK